MRAVTAAVLAALACGCGEPEPPELGYGAEVRVQAPSVGRGWLQGVVGTVGDCTVVMIGEPPEQPRRIYPVDFASVDAIEARDSTRGGWTPIPVEALRERHPPCLPGAS